MIKRKILAAVATAGAFLLLSASSAYAGTDSPTQAITGSKVWFTNDGDIVHVQDTACDSHAAVAKVADTHEGLYEEIWNHAGCGTTVTYSYGIRIDEGDSVGVQACIGVGGTTDVCAGYYVFGVA